MGIKLFSKEIVLPIMSNNIQFFLSPILGLIIILTVFYSFPFFELNFSIRLSLVFIYMILSINVYPVLFSGWSSNRKYALLGRLRSVAQTISYEVRLALILIFYLIFIAEYARIIFIRIIFSIFFFSRNRNIILLYFISSVIIRV